MRRCATGRHQLVADPRGEREVGQPVAVQVTDLAVVDGELHAAEPVRVRLNAWPARYLCDDRARGVAHLNLPNLPNRPDLPDLPRPATYTSTEVEGGDWVDWGDCADSVRLLVCSGISGNASSTSSAAASRTVAYT